VGVLLLLVVVFVSDIVVVLVAAATDDDDDDEDPPTCRDFGTPRTELGVWFANLDMRSTRLSPPLLH
jgi:hypothetical protein